MYRNILILLIFIGIVCIVIDITKTENKCPNNKIIYRFIPRTLDEELESPVYPTDVFKVMFSQPSPWIGDIDNQILRKREDINKFFISQV
jgi:hypothetical protein